MILFLFGKGEHARVVAEAAAVAGLLDRDDEAELPALRGRHPDEIGDIAEICLCLTHGRRTLDGGNSNRVRRHRAERHQHTHQHGGASLHSSPFPTTGLSVTLGAGLYPIGVKTGFALCS